LILLKEISMSTVPNHALRQLRAGKLAIGLGVRNARTVDIAQVAKTAGFDWLFVDCEHSSMDLDMAAQISAASLAVGVTPLVRVAGFEHWHASRILDNGAQGIVFPHVDDAAQAKRVADACRFPPVGKRSMGGGLQQLVRVHSRRNGESTYIFMGDAGKSTKLLIATFERNEATVVEVKVNVDTLLRMINQPEHAGKSFNSKDDW